MPRFRRQATVLTFALLSFLLNCYFILRNNQYQPGSWASPTRYEGMLRVMRFIELEREVEGQVRDEFVDKIWNCMKAEFTVLAGKPVASNLPSNVLASSFMSAGNRKSVFHNRNSLMYDTTGGDVKTYDDYAYVSDQAEACVSNGISIIIASPSSPTNFDRRKKMRLGRVGQFASNPQNRAKLLFFVGMPTDSKHQRAREIQDKLNEEQSQFQDIVQSTFVDTYRNITKKGLLLPKWISTFCPRAEVALRIDDDVDVNVSAMVSAVREVRQKLPHFILGVIRENVSPDRKKGSKCYLALDEYPYRTLPQFLLGGSMGYPTGTAKLIFEACRRVFPEVWLDDVWVTAMCARRVAVPIFDNPAFYFEHNGKRSIGIRRPR